MTGDHDFGCMNEYVPLDPRLFHSARVEGALEYRLGRDRFHRQVDGDVSSGEEEEVGLRLLGDGDVADGIEFGGAAMKRDETTDGLEDPAQISVSLSTHARE